MNDPTQSLAMTRIVTLAMPLVLLLGALVSPGIAHAGQNQVTVSYADLDLSKPEGRATLDRRLDKAIADVCRIRFPRSVRSVSQTRECIIEATENIEPIRSKVVADARAEAARRSLAANPR